MSEFVFLFRSSVAGIEAAMGSPEAAKQSMAAWLAWIRDLEARGALKNPGQPLARGGKVVQRDLVTDGPYAESKDIVAGFIVVEARDLDHAAELARACPMVLGGGGSVEIRPVDRGMF